MCPINRLACLTERLILIRLRRSIACSIAHEILRRVVPVGSAPAGGVTTGHVTESVFLPLLQINL